MPNPIFPYFGGKRRAAQEVWQALGTVDRYIEPFFGSGAVLLGAPVRPKSELVNDIDHHVANLWRALQRDPEEVWRVASAPCSEVELKARQTWLRSLPPLDLSDLSACDVERAGVWLWCACAAITEEGTSLRRGGHGVGIKGLEFTRDWYDAVCERMARVQVLCGDWTRCVTDAALCAKVFPGSVAGIFLDPPYGEGNGIAYEDRTGTAAADVWRWALANGDNPRLRIVVAGYEDGRTIPADWYTIERSEHGGYSAGSATNQNRHRERLWLSPHCQSPRQLSLLG